MVYIYTFRGTIAQFLIVFSFEQCSNFFQFSLYIYIYKVCIYKMEGNLSKVESLCSFSIRYSDVLTPKF